MKAGWDMRGQCGPLLLAYLLEHKMVQGFLNCHCFQGQQSSSSVQLCHSAHNTTLVVTLQINVTLIELGKLLCPSVFLGVPRVAQSVKAPSPHFSLGPDLRVMRCSPTVGSMLSIEPA